jgi:hypothetical protein
MPEKRIFNQVLSATLGANGQALGIILASHSQVPFFLHRRRNIFELRLDICEYPNEKFTAARHAK